MLNNAFNGIKYTGLYIGEHGGLSEITNFVLENNYIDGSQITRNDIVGYGIEMKINVKPSVARNNVIVNTKGPGIMVYGTSDGNPDDANIVEGNIVAGSRKNSGY